MNYKFCWRLLLDKFSLLDVKSYGGNNNVTACQLFWHTLYALPIFLAGCIASLFILLAFVFMVMAVTYTTLIPFVDFVRYYILGLEMFGEFHLYIMSFIVWVFIYFIYLNFYTDVFKKKEKKVKEPTTPFGLMYKSFKEKTCYIVNIGKW